MKEKVLNQRGITLIALIITIIILVILAAVSINAIANMGIVGHAVNGSQKYASESVKENKILGDTVNVIDSTLGNLENIQNGNASGESSSGTPVADDPSVPEEPETPASGTLASGTYTAGQEVVYNTTTENFELMTSSNSSNSEHFYVVSDEGTKVNLLTKYCLLRDASAQTDKDATYNGEGTAGYGRVFSSTNYWNGKDGVTYPFDLQTTTALGWIPSADTAENNAILAAQAYGESKGVKRKINEKRRS